MITMPPGKSDSGDSDSDNGESVYYWARDTVS